MRGQFKRGGGFEKESLVRTRMEDTSNFAQVGLVSLTCSTGLPWPVLYQRITAKPASVRRSSLFEKPTWSSILVLVVSLTSAAVAEKPTIMPNNLWHCGISPWFFQISQREILCHQTDPSPTEQANNLGGESKTCLVCTFFFSEFALCGYAAVLCHGHSIPPHFVDSSNSFSLLTIAIFNFANSRSV